MPKATKRPRSAATAPMQPAPAPLAPNPSTRRRRQKTTSAPETSSAEGPSAAENLRSTRVAAARKVVGRQHGREKARERTEQALREQVQLGKQRDKEAREAEKRRQWQAADDKRQAQEQAAAARAAQRAAKQKEKDDAAMEKEDRLLEEALMLQPPSVASGQTASAARFACVVAEAAREAVGVHPAAVTALAPLLVRSEHGPSGTMLALLEKWRTFVLRVADKPCRVGVGYCRGGARVVAWRGMDIICGCGGLRVSRCAL